MNYANVLPFDMTGVTVVEYRGVLGKPKVEYDLPANQGLVEADFPVSKENPRRRLSRQMHIVRIDSRSTGSDASGHMSRSGGVRQTISNSTVGGDVSQINNVRGNVRISRGQPVTESMPNDPHHPFVLHLPKGKEGQIELRVI